MRAGGKFQRSAYWNVTTPRASLTNSEFDDESSIITAILRGVFVCILEQL